MPEVKKEGSTAAFVLCLIGGILGIISGFYRIIEITFIRPTLVQTLSGTGLLGKIFVDALNRGVNLTIIFSIISFIAAITILVSSFFMRKDNSLKRASVVALVASIIGLNILGIIGSIIGLLKKTS